MTKLSLVLDLVERVLGEFRPLVRVMEHYVGFEGSVEYINLKVVLSELDAVLVIRQYWRRGVLVAYGYYVRVGDYEEWWDNRPHHRDVPSYPHHRHVGDEVKPLLDPSLESFLARVKELLKEMEKHN